MFSPHRLAPVFEASELGTDETDAAPPRARRAAFEAAMKRRHAGRRVVAAASDHPCCFKRVPCARERAGWVDERRNASLALLRSPEAPFAVFAGEPDFHALEFRACEPRASGRCG